MSRKASAAVAITITAMLSTGLVGCSSDTTEADYAKVCRDATTGNRLDDQECEDNDRAGNTRSHVGWYFLPIGSSGRTIPAVGSSVNASDGTTVLPSGKSAGGGVSAKGGSISRGGFGGAKAGS